MDGKVDPAVGTGGKGVGFSVPRDLRSSKGTNRYNAWNL